MSCEFPRSFHFTCHVIYYFSPYGHRCKNLHDPQVTSDEHDESNVIVLEHCTKAKRNGLTIPDRLYHHQLNSSRQSNPLIASYIWENCRPSRSSDESLDWMDTYNLVCNAGTQGNTAKNAYPKSGKRRTGNGPRYSDVVNRNNPPKVVVLGELQKLCIVMKMRDMDDTHLDFTYAPVDCELQFRLVSLSMIMYNYLFITYLILTQNMPFILFILQA